MAVPSSRELTPSAFVERLTLPVWQATAAVRGLEVSLTFDESFFEGTNAYLMAAMLERFMRKYVSINSFSETVFSTQQRGEITRWRPESGMGRII